MKNFLIYVGLLLCVSLSGQEVAVAAQNHELGKKVVVSIKPIHSLVAGVMKGVGEPYLIVKNANSPHTYRLRPSDGQALSNAKIVFWVGPKFEQFLKKPISSFAKQSMRVALINIEGLVKHEVRQMNAINVQQETHEHGAHEHGAHEHGAQQYDSHIWLDPENAKKIVKHITKTLINADPKNAIRYQQNSLVMIAKLDQLIIDISARLKGVQRHKFLVFHDAYQYFEKRFGLNFSGSVVINANQIIGARQLVKIQDRVRALKIRCIFSEPQFSPRLVKSIAENQKIRLATLDPMGALLAPDKELYFDLMANMASSFKNCFE